MSAKVDLKEKLSLFTEHYTPKIVADFNDCEVRIVKVKGPFVWHSHEDTDELFMVIDGELVMEFRDRVERLSPGEFIVIAKGVEHRPNSPEECSVMFLARSGTRNTGQHETELTAKNLERL